MDRKLRKTFLLAGLVLCESLFFSSEVFPFATDSHKIINRRAAAGSQAFNPQSLNALGTLGFAGLATEIKNSKGVNKSIIEWIAEGGAAEDRLLFSGLVGELAGGLTRSLNHFHQPVRNAWDQAGYLRANPSSARWAQDSFQRPGRRASWFDARNSYIAALQATTEQQRNSMFAETFQTLGQHRRGRYWADPGFLRP